MSVHGMEEAAKGMSTRDLGHQLKELNDKPERRESEEIKRKIIEKEWDQRPLHERVAAGFEDLVNGRNKSR